MKIPKLIFWKLYELEFPEDQITSEKIEEFLFRIGLENYEDISTGFYEVKFNDETKWIMFKFKHGISVSKDDFDFYYEMYR